MMPADYLYRCTACGHTEERYRNVKRCRKCRGLVVRQEETMSEEILSVGGLLARIEALEAERDQQTARAEILAAQVAGWAASSAAQVDVIRRALNDCPYCCVGTCTAPAHAWLRTVVETDAGAVLLTRLAEARAEALALRTAVETFLGEQIHVQEPSGNLYWMFYEGAMSGLRMAITSNDASTALLAELTAARRVVVEAMAYYALLFEDSVDIVISDEQLRAAFTAYDQVTKGTSKQ